MKFQDAFHDNFVRFYNTLIVFLRRKQIIMNKLVFVHVLYSPPIISIAHIRVFPLSLANSLKKTYFKASGNIVGENFREIADSKRCFVIFILRNSHVFLILPQNLTELHLLYLR